MLILKENGTVTLAYFPFNPLAGGGCDYPLEKYEENLPLFALPDSDGTVAGCDSVAMAEQLRYAEGLFPKELNRDDLIRDTVPRLRDFLADLKMLSDANKMPRAILLAQGDRAFVIDTDFTVSEVAEYETTFASDLLIPLLVHTKELSVGERIRLAAEGLEKSLLTHFPCYVIDTETQKIRALRP